MAGNNLFGGLNSGDSSKYKKAGEQATKRERAEQLDARIESFLSKKQDIEWATTALSFVEEETRLNSDIFDLSLNASRLTEIKEKANYIIEKKKKAEADALKKRIDELDKRIAALDKEQRTVEWAERALKVLRNEENQNADILTSLNNFVKIKSIKAEAEAIIKKDIADKEAAKKAAEAEAKRQAAEKKAQEERIAKEKEEVRVSNSAADVDKLIFDLSKAEKSFYWCEDVKNAQNLVNNLELKIRAKCKNLLILSDLAKVAEKVSKACIVDKKILSLVDDCERDEKNYPSVIEFEKTILDSVRPYLREEEALSALLKKAKDYVHAEEVKQVEIRRQQQEKLAEEQKLMEEVSECKTELTRLFDATKKDKSKFCELDNFLSSIPSRVLKCLDKKTVELLKKSIKDYKDKEAQNKLDAENEEKAILKLIEAFKKDGSLFESIIKKHNNIDKSLKPYLNHSVLQQLETANSEASKIQDAHILKEKKAEEKLRLKRQKAERLAAFNRRFLPVLFTLLIVGVTAGAVYLFPADKDFALFVGATVLSVWTAAMCIGLFGRPFGRVFPLIFRLLVVIASFVVLALYVENSIFAIVYLTFEILLYVISMFFGKRKFLTLRIVFSLVVLALAIVVAYSLKGVSVDLGSFGSKVTITVCTVATLLYVVLWFFLESAFGRDECIPLLAVTNAINPCLLVASIVFSSIGGKFAPVGMALGIMAFLAYLSCCTVGIRGNDILVSTFLLGISAVITSISVGVSCFEGWTCGMVIGFPCLVSFIPFFVFVCIEKCDGFDESEGRDVALCYVLYASVIALGVMAIVGSVNFSGSMLFLNIASLFNAVLLLIAYSLILYDIDDEGLFYGSLVPVVIFLIVATPVSIVQMVGHAKSYNEVAQIIDILHCLIPFLK